MFEIIMGIISSVLGASNNEGANRAGNLMNTAKSLSNWVKK